jgi:hypothetical protein
MGLFFKIGAFCMISAALYRLFNYKFFAVFNVIAFEGTKEQKTNNLKQIPFYLYLAQTCGFIWFCYAVFASPVGYVLIVATVISATLKLIAKLSEQYKTIGYQTFAIIFTNLIDVFAASYVVLNNHG